MSLHRAIHNVLVVELAGEGLLYDLTLHRAHSVNALGLAVFRALDGKTTVAQVARQLRGDVLGAVEVNDVVQAIAELERAQLIVPPRLLPSRGRRKFLGQLALTTGLSVAVPMVFSIVAPSVAEAASAVVCQPATACTNSNLGACCGTPGSPAKTCNVGGTCGNNSSNSKCRDTICK